MKLLIIFGPPAVGKATIASLIEERTDYKLFHNHMVTDGIMHIFGKESSIESRLSKRARTMVIEAAAKANINLIFTYVWDFSKPRGKHNVDHYKNLYEKHGGAVQFIELYAPLEERIQRADSEERWRRKYHTATGKEVEKLEEGRSFISPTPFYYPDLYTRVDATGDPTRVAARILELM